MPVLSFRTEAASFINLIISTASSLSQSLVAFPKLKRQVLSYDPVVSSPKDFAEGTLFYVNQEFSLM